MNNVKTMEEAAVKKTCKTPVIPKVATFWRDVADEQRQK